MYLSLNSTLVAGRVPWPEFARLAAKVGYPGVDVDLAAAMKAGLPATNNLLEDLKIKPAAVNLPVEFRKDDAAFRKDLEKLAAWCRRYTPWTAPRPPWPSTGGPKRR